jgi:hypothetical protein
MVGRSPTWGQVRCRVAGKFEILSGLVKILKHSARLVLLVTDGLKVMSSFLFFAIEFLAFLVGVSERLSCRGGLVSRLSFGVIF